MEWVHKESKHLDKLTDAKLKIYISALKEQVADLEQQKYSLRMHPKFNEISEYASFTEKYAISRIRKEMKFEEEVKTDFINKINEFEENTDKKQILKFIKLYLDELEEKNGIFNLFDEMSAFEFFDD